MPNNDKDQRVITPEELEKSVKPEVVRFQIANYAEMMDASEGKTQVVFNNGQLGEKGIAFGVRVDNIVNSSARPNGSTGLSGDFNIHDVVDNAKQRILGAAAQPEKYQASIYFKKGFVHEVDEGRPDGGATLSAKLGHMFDAPEDGSDFVQADVGKMVKMAIESEGFEIALDFNADQDGGDVVYTTEFLDANDGKIRKILESELGETGIHYEGRPANDVLADYRGYVAEQKIEAAATAHYAQTLSGVELEEAVEHFMEEKFNLNVDKVSYSDKNATLEGHDQSERAVNLVFQETQDEHAHENGNEHGHQHVHAEGKEHNHTHIVRAKDELPIKGRAIVRMGGDQYDEASLFTFEPSEKRLDNISTYGLNRQITYSIEIDGATNMNIDNLLVTVKADGDITSSYNIEQDTVDVYADGKLLAIVSWPRAEEDIDPSRLMIGAIDAQGNVQASRPDNVPEEISAIRRMQAGITPITDGVEALVSITAQCKNFHLLSQGDSDAYNKLIDEAGLSERLENVKQHLEFHSDGVSYDDVIMSVKTQYLNTEHANFNPQEIIDEDSFSVQIAISNPDKNIDVYDENLSAINAVSALHNGKSYNELNSFDVVSTHENRDFDFVINRDPVSPTN